ncbi:MAG: hypothetical protein IT291_02870 [Deltaproteobacteria bacterium]|nr:hypothetical protein [Deltaproteobacteria bacterium]
MNKKQAHSNIVWSDAPLLGAAHEATTVSARERYAIAENKMKRGKHLVVAGFVVAVIGIFVYCVSCLSANVNQNLETNLLERPIMLVEPALGIIAIGTLLWLIGSFIYLSGGMDSDPENPDLYF